MTPERWKQVDELVQAALERQAHDRPAFLDQACVGDAELRREVESLIYYQEQAAGFLQSTALKDAAPLLAAPDRASRPGQMIGHYQLINKLAAGGMGEVHLAEDTRLERRVAVKFLLADAAADQTARKRFIREAQIAAKLDHPNICAIYETGEENEQCYIVMQYIEGETLASRLKRQPLALSEALEIAVQVAEALSEAHARGIIHRDLKPQNIMLTPRGQVKVLDFGLAKVTEHRQAAARAAQSTSLLSGPGIIAGTLPYMSPEQVKGEALDGRSDIFSFGVVLYEMLSGQQPFKADSSAGTIAAILERQPPPLPQFASAVPSELEQIVAKALEKDREERYQVVKDMLLDLKRLKRRLETAPSLPAMKADVVRQLLRGKARLWVVSAALLLLALLVSLSFAIGSLRRTGAEVRTLRLNFNLPEKATLRSLALAPDGSRLAFTAVDAAGKTLLYVRPLDSLTAQPLTGTDGAEYPFWSPDSRFIGFFGQSKLKRIEATGGLPQIICHELKLNGLGGTWNRDGVIVFAAGWTGGLYRVSAAGGEPTPLTTPDRSRQEISHRWPQFLPDGRSFLYFVESGRLEVRGIYVSSLAGKGTKRLLDTASSAVYAPPGYLLFRREGALMAQAFDAQKLELVSEPLLIADQVGAYPSWYYLYLTAAENGVLAYHKDEAEKTQLAWLNRGGNQLGVVGLPSDYLMLALSPDDKQIAFDSLDPRTSARDLWLLELARGTLSRFTFDPAGEGAPVWSRDGRSIAFSSNRGGLFDLYRRAASGAGDDELLFKSSYSKVPTDWSPDGRFILYTHHDPKTKTDIWVLPLEGERQPFPFLQTEFTELQAQFSPNGKWIAYTSNETDDSGTFHIYVQSFPASGRKWQVSTGSGGVMPRWRGDGRELFYWNDTDNLMAVEVKTDGVFEAGVPKLLFKLRHPAVAHAQGKNFMVTGDGQRFLVRSAVENNTTAITVVVNWTAEVKR